MAGRWPAPAGRRPRSRTAPQSAASAGTGTARQRTAPAGAPLEAGPEHLPARPAEKTRTPSPAPGTVCHQLCSPGAALITEACGKPSPAKLMDWLFCERLTSTSSALAALATVLTKAATSCGCRRQRSSVVSWGFPSTSRVKMLAALAPSPLRRVACSCHGTKRCQPYMHGRSLHRLSTRFHAHKKRARSPVPPRLLGRPSSSRCCALHHSPAPPQRCPSLHRLLIMTARHCSVPGARLACVNQPGSAGRVPAQRESESGSVEAVRRRQMAAVWLTNRWATSLERCAAGSRSANVSWIQTLRSDTSSPASTSFPSSCTCQPWDCEAVCPR